MSPLATRFVAALVIACGLVLAATAGAITVDGQLDAPYTLVSAQTTQTSENDALTGTIDFCSGSELDAAYAAIDGGVLYLFFAGNLRDQLCGSQACAEIDALEVFLDTQAGGQNTLLSASPSGFALAGLSFDAGFAPDYQFEYWDGGPLTGPFFRNAYEATLPSGGGGTSTFLGSGPNAGAPGTLSGGTNPFGIQATIDNRNVVGVDHGCAAASGSGVTSGIELAIPLAAIGHPTGCITGTALIYNPTLLRVTNQVLGPVPTGTCALGAASTVNFGAIAGAQTFTICLAATAVRNTTWGALKTIYR